MVKSHDPLRATDVIVHVNGTRLPVADVDIHIRQEGDLDITRYAEVEFASPFEGVEYVDAFQGTTPEDQGEFDTTTIAVRDRASGGAGLVFRGVVTGVGSSSSGNSKIWTFRAQGPGHLLSNIPASKKFGDARASDVFEYVRSTLESRTPFNIDSQWTSRADYIENPAVNQEGNIEAFLSYSFEQNVPFGDGVADTIENTLVTTKTFQSNRHTLADVVTWLQRKFDFYVWLAPKGDGLTLVATTDPHTVSHRAHYLGGNLYVENNDALSELRPVNTQIVVGGAKRSYVSVGPFELNSSTDTYNVAKARHTGLYERAGERELHGEKRLVSDAETKQQVEYEARHILKSSINGATAGDMSTLLRGPITPYDTVEAVPVCNGQVTDEDSLTYEVSRVHHKIPSDGMAKTTLNVGLHVDDGDIEVIDSWSEDT